MFETMTSAFTDEFPHLFKKRKLLLTAGLCTMEFLLGIPCTMNGGIYFLQIMDWYSSTFSLMILSFTECMVIAWIYGVNRFYEDIELMIGYKPNMWWKLCWRFITPITILFVFLFTVVQHTPVMYGEYVYPSWAIGVGWMMAISSMAPLPIFFIIKYYQSSGRGCERIMKQLKPNASWGPALDVDRGLYIDSLLKAEKSGSTIMDLDVVTSLSSKNRRKHGHREHTHHKHHSPATSVQFQQEVDTMSQTEEPQVEVVAEVDNHQTETALFINVQPSV